MECDWKKADLDLLGSYWEHRKFDRVLLALSFCTIIRSADVRHTGNTATVFMQI